MQCVSQVSVAAIMPMAASMAAMTTIKAIRPIGQSAIAYLYCKECGKLICGLDNGHGLNCEECLFFANPYQSLLRPCHFRLDRLFSFLDFFCSIEITLRQLLRKSDLLQCRLQGAEQVVVLGHRQVRF